MHPLPGMLLRPHFKLLKFSPTPASLLVVVSRRTFRVRRVAEENYRKQGAVSAKYEGVTQ